MRQTTSEDVFCAVVPEDVSPDDPHFLLQLKVMAQQWVHAQWAGRPGPRMVLIRDADWLVTNKVYEVDAFQPAHDCEECRSGNELTKDFLRTNPGRYVAMANLTYTSVWDE